MEAERGGGHAPFNFAGMKREHLQKKGTGAVKDNILGVPPRFLEVPPSLMTHLIARFRANGNFIPLGTGKFVSIGNLQLKVSKEKNSHFL